ncbi:MAG: class I SAM-dependent methyltransferase [bacterium]
MVNQNNLILLEYRDSIKEQYEIERKFATKIKLAQKNSELRRNLLRQAYTEVSKIELTYPSHLTIDCGLGAYLVPVIMALPLSGKKVLEVGCGTGSLCVALAKKGFVTTGLDLSPVRIEKAKERAKQSNQNTGNFMVCNFMEAPLPDTDFDVIINDNVLEHIPMDEASDFILNCKAKLKSGGWLISITPNRLVGPYDVSGYFLPRGTAAQGLHLKEYTFAELTTLLNRAELGTLYSLPATAQIAARLGLINSRRIWWYKSTIMEKILRLVPGPLRIPKLFRVLVSDIIIAQK